MFVGGQQADHGAAAVGGVGFADEQPLLLHAPDLVGEPALLPLHEGTEFLRGHMARGVLREHPPRYELRAWSLGKWSGRRPCPSELRADPHRYVAGFQGLVDSFGQVIPD